MIGRQPCQQMHILFEPSGQLTETILRHLFEAACERFIGQAIQPREHF